MKNKKGNVAVIAAIMVIVAITAGVIGFMFASKSKNIVQIKEKMTVESVADKSESSKNITKNYIETGELRKIFFGIENILGLSGGVGTVYDSPSFAEVAWIGKDKKAICLNQEVLSVSSANELSKASLDRMISELSSYLISKGFVTNLENTAKGDEGAGATGLEKGNLKCKMSYDYTDIDKYTFNVSCAELTEKDQQIFDELYPAMYKALEIEKYPGAFFCVQQMEGDYAMGGTSILQENGLAFAGAGIYAKKKNGEWDILITQDVLPCSFTGGFPKSFELNDCADDNQ